MFLLLYLRGIFSLLDLERPGSSKKHRKSTSGQPLTRIGSPGSLLKPAMTERQQMVLLKQMTSTEIPKSPGLRT